MRPLTDLRINRFEVKLVSPADHFAKAVIEFLSKQHAPLLTIVRGTNLGDVYIDQAYIYPPITYKYGQMSTGKVVSARQIRATATGEPLLEPDIQGPIDPNDWAPEILGFDGKFHPRDRTQRSQSGEWTL